MIITSCRDFINRHSSRQLCCYPRDACLHFQAMKSHRLLLWQSPQFDIKMGCAKLDSLHNTNWISDRAWLIPYRPDIVWLNVEKSDRQTSQVSTYTVCKQVKTLLLQELSSGGWGLWPGHRKLPLRVDKTANLSGREFWRICCAALYDSGTLYP